MRYTIIAKPNSRVEKVQEIDKATLAVSVKAQARDGRANESIVHLLSRYFDIPKSRIQILKGHTSKRKIVEII